MKISLVLLVLCLTFCSTLAKQESMEVTTAAPRGHHVTSRTGGRPAEVPLTRRRNRKMTTSTETPRGATTSEIPRTTWAEDNDEDRPTWSGMDNEQTTETGLDNRFLFDAPPACPSGQKMAGGKCRTIVA